MKTITKEELGKVLENHLHWLREDCDGWGNMRADLSNTDLRYADLRSADLSSANLSSANLSSANLRSADLSYADLRSADLSSANLSSADLSYADLSSAKNIPFIPYSCPDFGMFIGFKKAYYQSEPYIVVLEIPEDARRLSANGRKCRCDKAKVLEIQNIDGSKADIEFVCSQYDSSFHYKVGEIVSVDNFCEDRWNECSQGIHFFINRQEAVNY